MSRICGLPRICVESSSTLVVSPTEKKLPSYSIHNMKAVITKQFRETMIFNT